MTRGIWPRPPGRPTATTTASAIRTTPTRPGVPGGGAHSTAAWQDAGAVFGTKHGWERADHLEPGASWRMAGEDQRAYGSALVPPWLDAVGKEHRAVRGARGAHRPDLIRQDRGRRAWGVGAAAAGLGGRFDRPIGTVVYTQWLMPTGGMVADVTVVRSPPTDSGCHRGGLAASDSVAAAARQRGEWSRWGRQRGLACLDCGDHRPATSSARSPTTTSAMEASPSGPPAPCGSAAATCSPSASRMRGSSDGNCTSSRRGRSSCGTGWRRLARSTGSPYSGIGRWTA